MSVWAGLTSVGLIGLAGCAAPAPATETVVPVYSEQTGRLEQLVSDSNGDGRIDTRAFMDGARLLRIELDRNGDGRFDRVEYYGLAAHAGTAQIERAEEANSSDDRITLRAFYSGGKITRLEEDTDGDGRIDKWEHYQDGFVSRLELDLTGGGFPNRRTSYRPDGGIDRVEADPDGRGNWRPFVPHESSNASSRTR